MNSYKLTWPNGTESTRQSTDMRMALTVAESVNGEDEPTKIELVQVSPGPTTQPATTSPSTNVKTG